MDSLAIGNEIHWECFLFFLHISLVRPAGILMWGSGTWYCYVILRFFSTARKPHQAIQKLVWNTVVQFNTIYIYCSLYNLAIISCGICTTIYLFWIFFPILNVIVITPKTTQKAYTHTQTINHDHQINKSPKLLTIPWYKWRMRFFVNE